jgi:L-arabinose isomerase
MRDVAVTEGNKVDAQIDFGYEVHGFAFGDYIEGYFKKSREAKLRTGDQVSEEYPIKKSTVSEEVFQASIREAARIEIALRGFWKRADSSIHIPLFRTSTG